MALAIFMIHYVKMRENKTFGGYWPGPVDYLSSVERSTGAHTNVAHTCMVPSRCTGTLLDAVLKEMVPQNLTATIKDTAPTPN